MAVARTIWFSFHLSCHRSALSLKRFSSDSSDSDNRPDVGIGPLLQFPHPLRASPVLLTLLFFTLVPSSYWVLHGSIFSFLLVRYSCLLSAGVLYTFLCVWRYIPDVSMERDVLHVYLLLCHLVLLSLFFHMLSRFVIAFLPKSKHLLISWL